MRLARRAPGPTALARRKVGLEMAKPPREMLSVLLRSGDGRLVPTNQQEEIGIEAAVEAPSAQTRKDYTSRPGALEQAGNNLPEYSQSRTKLWQGLHQVVARSPDLATSPTEGLQPRPHGRPAVRQTAGSGDPPRTAANWKSGGYSRPVPNPATTPRQELGMVSPELRYGVPGTSKTDDLGYA